MKRFTEALKWRDPWFRALSVDGKLVFFYLIDNCDASGVWEPDYQLANFCLKRDIEWERVAEELGNRIATLPSGKWFLTRFCRFQYGQLNSNCAPHRSVIEIAKRNGLTLDKHGFVTFGLPLPKGSGRDKEKEKEKEKDQEGGTGETNGASDAGLEEQIYGAYPRKTGKQDGLKAIAKVLEKFPVWRPMLLGKVQEYAAAVAKWPEDERQYVPHPATWFNRGSYEDDPKTWERKNANNRPSNGRGFENQQSYAGITEKL